MRRENIRSYLLLFGATLILMTIPKVTSERIRGATVAFFSPLWRSSSSRTHTHKIEQLRLENQLLRNEIKRLAFASENDDTSAFPAQVIFRSPATWDSSLWIDIGERDNKKAQRRIITQNSPVMVGTSVVGVVDYVGKRQSRVRLITDSGLSPSVRAMRIQDGKTWYLAKGELHGSRSPRWRSNHHTLHGIGFNYDFSDAQGPARDLRSGTPVDGDVPAMPIIQKDDILVTTGMDGVFPAGLHIAKVTHIHLLKEGDYVYALEAVPTADHLDEISLVFVIPPQGYDTEDQPPAIGW